MTENENRLGADWSRVEGAIGKSNLEILRTKSVVVVGMGSLGMNITRLLAMNGVKNFNLIDPDVVKPANITRLPASISDINKKKVLLGREIIKSKNPQAYVHIESIDARFSSFFDVGHDLIIIAGLGSQDIQEQIANRSLKKGRKVLVAGVYGTGNAGEMFVLKPDKGPCYTCFRELTRNPEGQIRTNNPYGVPTDQVEAVPGLANNIEIVAALAVDTAMNTLLGKPISHHNNPDTNMYIFAINKIKIHFPLPKGVSNDLGPLAVMFFALPKAVDCQNCNPKGPRGRRLLRNVLHD